MPPFNDYAREEIKERSGGVSELSGEVAGEEGMLQCAHLNHTRDENYNNPENGLRVTKFEECAYHKLHIDCPEKIGMEDIQNRSVIMSYVQGFFRKGFTLEEVRFKTGGAIDDWKKFLKGREVGYTDNSKALGASLSQNSSEVCLSRNEGSFEIEVFESVTIDLKDLDK